jgi:hypothetical protein
MAARDKLVMNLLAASGPWRIPKLCDNKGNRLDSETAQLGATVLSNKDKSIPSTFQYNFCSSASLPTFLFCKLFLDWRQNFDAGLLQRTENRIDLKTCNIIYRRQEAKQSARRVVVPAGKHRGLQTDSVLLRRPLFKALRVVVDSLAEVSFDQPMFSISQVACGQLAGRPEIAELLLLVAKLTAEADRLQQVVPSAFGFELENPEVVKEEYQIVK